MLHNCHTEKPRNSAKIDGHRLRRASRRPFVVQNALSSGSQASIQRPGRGASTVPIAPVRSASPAVVVVSSVMAQDARCAVFPPGHPVVTRAKRLAHTPARAVRGRTTRACLTAERHPWRMKDMTEGRGNEEKDAQETHTQ